MKLIYPDQKSYNYLVAIRINNVIPSRSFVVDKELDRGHRLDLTQLREQFLAFGPGNRSQQGRGGRLLEFKFQLLGFGWNYEVSDGITRLPAPEPG